MKAIGVSGSPRAGGNTETAIDLVLEAVRSEGIETEHIKLREHGIARGCTACGACRQAKDGLCAGVKDNANPLFARLHAADAIVAGSPVYFGSATPELMAFLQRLGYAARGAAENPLRGKIAAGVAVARRAGQNFTVDQIQNVFGPLDMTLAGSSYWPIAFGRSPGDVLEDAEGVETMKTLGKNIARLIRKLRG